MYVYRHIFAAFIRLRFVTFTRVAFWLNTKISEISSIILNVYTYVQMSVYARFHPQQFKRQPVDMSLIFWACFRDLCLTLKIVQAFYLMGWGMSECQRNFTWFIFIVKVCIKYSVYIYIYIYGEKTLFLGVFEIIFQVICCSFWGAQQFRLKCGQLFIDLPSLIDLQGWSGKYFAWTFWKNGDLLLSITSFSSIQLN